MAYSKTVWTNGETALSDLNMNHIENGIFEAHEAIDALETTVAAIILAAHPVGSIEINTTGTNPGEYLGGTWVAWGSGRVPVGVNASDTEFNTSEKTGGAKTHTLTAAESGLPAHNHPVTVNVVGSGNLETRSDGAHVHTGYRRKVFATGTGTLGFVSGNQDSGAVDDAAQVTIRTTAGGAIGEHKHVIPTHTHSANASSSNAGPSNATSAHNNLQPYITCYMWKRTA